MAFSRNLHANIPDGPLSAVLALAICLSIAGCKSTDLGGHDWAPPKGPCQPKIPTAPPPELPRELQKTTLPDYVVEPPDILLIDAVRVVPLPPYRIETLDVLSLQVEGEFDEYPIEGNFEVQPGGFLDLGPPYGQVKVSGLQLTEATQAVRAHLKQFVQMPEVNIGLVQSAAKQQITGEHLVGPDGKVTLGTYGKVNVTGMTIPQVKQALETHLSQYLENPDVSVDVFAYNSKVFYVVTEGAGLGDGVARVPITGNETVLDAIAGINGLESVSSKRIWVARPIPYNGGCHQILPVDWHAITTRADVATNYQLMPGDRLFIAQDRLVAIDTALSKFTAPIERVLGVTLMGASTLRIIKLINRVGGGGGGGGF
jgi:polysaccharide biosynthesis/export protein